MSRALKRVVLVTGAASGIGRETAIAFARTGAQVVVSDVQEPEGIEAVRAIEGLGGSALWVRCDVSQEAEVRSLMARIQERFGRLDAAFNNAGIEGQSAFTAACTSENWDRVLSINLKGIWLCMKHEIPLMLSSGGGSIVNCASIAGLVGFQGLPAYVASKHGVLGLTRTAALEYARQGLRINAVCPGVIQTPMVDRLTQGDPKARDQLMAGEPVGRVGLPAEIAHAVVWLCSDEASFVTGHPLVVDGGWVAQ